MPVSIYRRPGTQRFQLVHRSQRDPLIHDPEAGAGVFKEIEGRGEKGKGKGKERAVESGRKNEPGEAANYGIYFDDSEYDYMQHLRTVGEGDESGEPIDSVLIPAPSTSRPKPAPSGGFALRERTFQETLDAQLAIPAELQGLQPDMDPALRQTLEALEDDAFLMEDPGSDDGADDDEEGDDWFGALVSGGQRALGEALDFGDEEDGGEEDEYTEEQLARDAASDDWQARFKAFKAAQKRAETSPPASELPESELDYARSEGGDTLASLRSRGAFGAARTLRKARRAGSDASGYSMSSSSMFRNDGLRGLDDRFDKIEEEYLDEDEEEDEDEDDDAAPSREDFSAILDDFLDNYEVLGGKMRPKLAGQTGAEKLDTFRRAMAGLDLQDAEEAADGRGKRGVEVEKWEGEEVREDGEEEEEADFPMPAIVGVGEKGERWDAETILSTYTNIENHPRKIRAHEVSGGRRKSRASPAPPAHTQAQISIDPRTGFPVVEKPIAEEDEDEEQSESDDEGPKRVTVARNKNESKEEKKARKTEVKAERLARRTEKKSNKEAFSTERKRQVKHTNTLRANADVAAVATGRGASVVRLA